MIIHCVCCLVSAEQEVFLGMRNGRGASSLVHPLRKARLASSAPIPPQFFLAFDTKSCMITTL